MGRARPAGLRCFRAPSPWDLRLEVIGSGLLDAAGKMKGRQLFGLGHRSEVRKSRSSFGKGWSKKHTSCCRCGSKAYHLQKSTCGKHGYPASEREIIPGVLKLQDEIPPGPAE